MNAAEGWSVVLEEASFYWEAEIDSRLLKSPDRKPEDIQRVGRSGVLQQPVSFQTNTFLKP
jgi:hypothetical protein